MRKLLLLAILGIGSMSIAAMTYDLLGESMDNNSTIELYKNQDGISAKFLLKNFQANEVSHGGFQQLQFKDLKLTSVAGRPELPYFSFLVAAKMSQLEVQAILGQAYEFSNLKPLPAQKMPCRSCEDDKFFSYEPKAYQKAPKKYYRLEPLGDFRGTRKDNFQKYL